MFCEQYRLDVAVGRIVLLTIRFLDASGFTFQIPFYVCCHLQLSVSKSLLVPRGLQHHVISVFTELRKPTL